MTTFLFPVASTRLPGLGIPDKRRLTIAQGRVSSRSSLISGGRSKAVWDERLDQRRRQRAQARGRQESSN